MFDKRSLLIRRGECKQRRRGVSAVEFALVAPLFFLMVIGVIEFGQAMMITGLLTNAAHEGARTGVLNNAQVSDVTSAVNGYLSSGGLSGASTSVTPDPPSSASAGQSVTVTVSIGFSKVSWLPKPWFLGGKTLSATSIMLRETGQ